MATHDNQAAADRRTTARRTFRVPLRMTTRSRLPQQADGETMDVSPSGLGVKFAGTDNPAKLDELLETLVEDRVPIEVMLRLPEGSLSSVGQVVWWGLLGDKDKFGIRAGILISPSWSDVDWELIEKNIRGG